ncbi:MAG TPA: HAMP domain-containing sensor histidine kinase [Candidatus Krumholzibacteria bacterium]|nr:HAMP domain-containing sensor histidine kinase [Candidatus Krumholzibacteria bacterium]
MTGGHLETHFAPAVRTEPSELARRIGLITNNPIVDTLLRAVGGLVAVIDENRQILAVNHAFLAGLGCRDSQQVLGLRPGEALGCVHADDMPGGCGTSAHCATCGAVLAIATAAALGEADERYCVAEVEREGAVEDLVLKVRACPIDLGGERLLLFVLQDATAEQRTAAMEQAFYHDTSNVLQALTVAAELMGGAQDEQERNQLAERVVHLVDQLTRDVGLQRALHGGDFDLHPLPLAEVPAAGILDELRSVFLHHPSAAGRTITFRSPSSDLVLRTDRWLLVRVLTNLVINALEATQPGGRVEILVSDGPGGVVFMVRNPAAIPREIQPRVFQKNFSTKHGPGHGLGAWSARVFTEELLGGTVTFTSSDRYGTEFRVGLPA